MRNFDNSTIQLITAFENIARTEVRDCLCLDTIYFLVNPGKMAKTIGKNGYNIKSAEKMLGRPIKVFEWSDDQTQFIKNIIPKAQKVEIEDGKCTVTLSSENRGSIIGKKGSNIKALRILLERNSDIKELKVV
ncbi:MAG: NusA-like transcription termination signal-binding factor [Candidatus Aenigmarchaeota archaeon]|nr:NusA-like transcription termination signal-binding factor [Candidatus Aenigmarchaeota archaeon]